ncbi:MAG: IPT/TIG domain-containing protein [Myxococcales bacterium]|nr:IPT/TIG domain-containing protein [Myxococcales bacterium]
MRLHSSIILAVSLLVPSLVIADPVVTRNDSIGSPNDAQFAFPLTTGNVAAACFDDPGLSYPRTLQQVDVLLAGDANDDVERLLTVLVYGRDTQISPPSTAIGSFERGVTVSRNLLTVFDASAEGIVLNGPFCVGVVSPETLPVLLASDGASDTDSGENWVLNGETDSWVAAAEAEVSGNFVIRAVTVPFQPVVEPDAGADVGQTDVTPGTPAVSIFTITPSRGDLGDEVQVDIAGTGFEQAFTYRIGPAPLVDIAVVNTSLVTATLLPASLDPGTYDVIVSQNGQVLAQLPQGFQVTSGDDALPPRITGIVPARLPVNVSTNIVLTGEGIQQGARLEIGGRQVATSTVVDDSTLRALIVGNHVSAPGLYDVVLTNPDGQTATLTGGFLFSAAEEDEGAGCSTVPTFPAALPGFAAALALTLAAWRRNRKS